MLLLAGHVLQPAADDLLGGPPEDGLGGAVPAHDLTGGAQSDDRERGGLHQGGELVARGPHRLLGGLALGDVALGAPDAGEVSVLDQADEVVEEPARLSEAVQLVGLEVGRAVPAADEGAEELEAARIVQVEAVAQPGADCSSGSVQAYMRSIASLHSTSRADWAHH